MDKLAFDRQYSPENREKRNAEDREFSTVQAQMQGAEVVKPPKEVSLLDMAKAAGANPRG